LQTFPWTISILEYSTIFDLIYNYQKIKNTIRYKRYQPIIAHPATICKKHEIMLAYILLPNVLWKQVLLSQVISLINYHNWSTISAVFKARVRGREHEKPGTLTASFQKTRLSILLETADRNLCPQITSWQLIQKAHNK
jgi:hypothetical protein